MLYCILKKEKKRKMKRKRKKKKEKERKWKKKEVTISNEAATEEWRGRYMKEEEEMR